MFPWQKRNATSVTGRRCIGSCRGGLHFAVYKCIKSLHGTPENHTTLYARYISVKLGPHKPGAPLFYRCESRDLKKIKWVIQGLLASQRKGQKLKVICGGRTLSCCWSGSWAVKQAKCYVGRLFGGVLSGEGCSSWGKTCAKPWAIYSVPYLGAARWEDGNSSPLGPWTSRRRGVL